MSITKHWLASWAAEYRTQYDEALEGLEGRPRFTRKQAEAVVRWKSARSIGYFRSNGEAAVRIATARAFAASDDAEALGALVSLQGVRERVASAILMASNQRRFTVMDRRALASLTKNGELKGVPKEDFNSWFRLWPHYLDACRVLATRHGLSLRDVDRALWAANGSRGLPPRVRRAR